MAKQKRLSPRELRRQVRLLTKMKRHIGKLCRELQLQRNCLEHVDDFANFLKQKATFTVTEPDLTPSSSLGDIASTSSTTITVNQQQHYYPGYDEEFQIHHQKFDRDFRYFRNKYVKLSHHDTVSSLYTVMYDLYDNCRVIGDHAEDDPEYHKSLFDQEMAEREKLQQESLPNNSLIPTISESGETAPLDGATINAATTNPTVVRTIVPQMSKKKKKKLRKKKLRLLRLKKLKELKEKEEQEALLKQRKKKKKSEKGNFKCPMISCHKKYKFKDNLLKHLLQHVEVKTEVLSDETVKLGSKRGRKRRNDSTDDNSDAVKPRRKRKSSLSGVSVYKCEFEGCEYSAPYRSALELHKVKHSTERPFKCHHCEKTFKQIYALKMHEMIHSGQQFQCPFDGCTAIYSWIYSLKKHMRIHTNQAPIHRCEWPACEYQTHRQDLLRKHMTRHTGERLFNCNWPDCGKSFKTRSGLYDHLLMHRNERKQVCTWPGCNYRCNLPGNLRKHIAIHEKKVIKLEPIADSDQITLLSNNYGPLGGMMSSAINSLQGLHSSGLLHHHHD